MERWIFRKECFVEIDYRDGVISDPFWEMYMDRRRTSKDWIWKSEACSLISQHILNRGIYTIRSASSST